MKLLKFFDYDSKSIDALIRITSFFCQEKNANTLTNAVIVSPLALYITKIYF
jgi:hypothetical protein